jgi:Firmicute plasmid replication protein (RepL)
MPKRKAVLQETKVIVNNEGEVLKLQRLKVIQFPSEPPFFKVYIADLTAVLGLPAAVKTVLYPLLMNMNYKNMIVLTTRLKKEIAQEAGVKPSTLDNHLCLLTKAGILTRIARSEYLVNPNYFTRGDWAETIKKREEWEMIVTYKHNGDRIVKGQRVKADD